MAASSLAAEKVIEVPTEKVVAASRALFGGKKKSHWYRQESQMTLPNGQTIHFDVPRFHLQFITPVGRRYWHYFINELELDRTRVVPAKDGIKLVMEFESAGNEIKGKCTRRTFNGKDNCEYRGSRDIQLDNARATVYLRPDRVKGRLGFAPIRPKDVGFNADIKVPKGLCRTINAMTWASYAMGAFAENLAGQHFANQCQKVRKLLAKSVADLVTSRLRQALNRPDVREHMAAFLTNELKLLPDKNWQLASVTNAGSHYRIALAKGKGKSPTSGKAPKTEIRQAGCQAGGSLVNTGGPTQRGREAEVRHGQNGWLALRGRGHAEAGVVNAPGARGARGRLQGGLRQAESHAA